jgi:hypothetical protein
VGEDFSMDLVGEDVVWVGELMVGGIGGGTNGFWPAQTPTLAYEQYNKSNIHTNKTDETTMHEATTPTT